MMDKTTLLETYIYLAGVPGTAWGETYEAKACAVVRELHREWVAQRQAEADAIDLAEASLVVGE